MSDDDSTPEKPERSERQIEVQRLAKQRAEQQGLSWKDMSKDERKSLKKSIAAELKQAENRDTSE